VIVGSPVGSAAAGRVRRAIKKSEPMRYVTGTLAVSLLVAIVIFSIQNRTAVDVSFLVWLLSVPKAFLILGTYLLGIVSGWRFRVGETCVLSGGGLRS
jgi:uncharacterized integral membrane protein